MRSHAARLSESCKGRPLREIFVSTTQFQAQTQSEIEEVLRWRFDELVRANYTVEDALDIAAHVEIDLHEAIALRDQGCPSATAVRILL